MFNPFHITIHHQSEDEEILHVWRRHPVTLVPPLLRVLGFLVIPLALIMVSGLAMFTHPLLFVLFLCILAIVLTIAFYEWWSWYGDVYVLTNLRLVDVEQDGFFHRNFAEAPLSNVEDVTYDIKGFWPTVFNYGNVTAQTAGSHPNITFNQIRNPAAMVRYLEAEGKNYRTEQPDDDDAEPTARELVDFLIEHHKDFDKMAKEKKAEAKQKKQQARKKATAEDGRAAQAE